ncbi:MAG: carboxypeptidase-like regulatory domain-containing protein [Bacteroidota bacterium]
MKNHILLLLAFLFSSTMLHAQVKGKIIEISEKGDTSLVPGAIVYWQNSSISAQTDANGDFQIKKEPSTNRLIIRAIGYANDTLIIKEVNRYLLIALKNNAGLNEVEVIYYSNGTEISYLNPIKVEVLNERSLMKAACCNLSESFETNPSIDVNFADAISGTKQIQMLGLSGQYAQITKENMPYLRGLANNYGLSFVPGTWIQSIQLSKGAGSVINGYESFTGQINTELQNPQQSDKLNFNTYANENGRNEYNLNLSHRINEKFSTALLSHFSANPLVQDHNGDGFADIPIGKQYNIMNKYAYSHKGFEAQFGGAYLSDNREGGQFKSLRQPAQDSLLYYKTFIRNKKWEVYSKTGYVFRKKPGTSMGLQLSYLNHDQNNTYGPNFYSGLQKTFYANFIYQGIIGSTNNAYKIGLSLMNDNVQESFTNMVANTITNNNNFSYQRNETVGGTFVEFAHNYKEKFNVVAGIRADYHNYYGWFATPRLHLRYAFSNKSILRLSGGRALRTANIFTDNSALMATARSWQIESNAVKIPKHSVILYLCDIDK